MKDNAMPWWQQPAAAISLTSRAQACERQSKLTKPAGSLGRLEEIAIDFAGWQGREKPSLDEVCIRVFAGDHGVVAEGISAFPQVVTGEMIRNFARGGAAIAVLAREQGADFAVVNMGTATPLEPLEGVTDIQIAAGTLNMCCGQAMTMAQLEQAMQAGADQVPAEAALFIGGEMGIGNTTSAAALTSAMLGSPVEATVGRGTGIDATTLQKKRDVVEKALALHSDALGSTLKSLACLGGLEIAGLTGAYIAAAQRGVPLLVDGYISSVAALAACRLNPGVRDWMMFAHRSGEPGHRYILNALKAEPLVNLGMRLGEGSGAGVVISLLRTALRLHAGMATFAEASVSDKDGQVKEKGSE